ncbi:MAG: zinc ribbon domain-containing protein [Eubacteriales bacterium]
MKCPNCGNELSDNAKFCPKCGTKIGADAGTGTPAPNPDATNATSGTSNSTGSSVSFSDIIEKGKAQVNKVAPKVVPVVKDVWKGIKDSTSKLNGFHGWYFGVFALVLLSLTLVFAKVMVLSISAGGFSASESFQLFDYIESEVDFGGWESLTAILYLLSLIAMVLPAVPKLALKTFYIWPARVTLIWSIAWYFIVKICIAAEYDGYMKTHMSFAGFMFLVFSIAALVLSFVLTRKMTGKHRAKPTDTNVQTPATDQQTPV